jgi:hypothetical protein
MHIATIMMAVISNAIHKDECANLVHGLPESLPDNLSYRQHGDFAPKAYETMSGFFFSSQGANAC